MKLNRNTRVAVICFTIFIGMIGAAYASVPFYRWFCQATGWDGQPRRAETAPSKDQVADRVIRIHFDANVAPGLSWSFRPDQQYIDVHVGDTGLATYTATNTSNSPTRGHASYNVLPEKSAKYFVKVACFCFSDQPLRPGESKQMPVSFYVDPAILKDSFLDDTTDIVLSYTFFEQTGPVAQSADEAAGAQN